MGNMQFSTGEQVNVIKCLIMINMLSLIHLHMIFKWKILYISLHFLLFFFLYTHIYTPSPKFSIIFRPNL